MMIQRTIAIFCLSAFAPLFAFAHHPLLGKLPTTWFEGLLSGFAHPVIEPEHLTFVLTVGLLAALCASPVLLPVVFVVGTLLGTSLSLANLSLPWAEGWVALSLIGIGLTLALGRGYSLSLGLGLGILAGVFHGIAYGKAVVGMQTGPILTYLLGLGAVQIVMAVGLAFVVGRLLRVVASLALLPRVVGVAMVGFGLLLLFKPQLMV